MGIRQPIQNEAGVAPGEIPVKGPMSPGGLPAIEGILHNGLLVGHLILKNPVGIQALHIARIRRGGVTRTIHEMNSKNQGLLLLMVRLRLVKKLRLGFLG